MTNSKSKAREFWVNKKELYDSVEKLFWHAAYITPHNDDVHVIEYDAYDQMKKELDSAIAAVQHLRSVVENLFISPLNEGMNDLQHALSATGQYSESQRLK